MKKLLITRELTDVSPINTLSTLGIKVTGQSYLRFEDIDFDEWNRDADWVFFYSKNGVRSAFANPKFLEFCMSVSIAVYGEMTADCMIQEYDLTPHFIGDGSRENTLDKYLLSHPKHTLFVQGSRSLKALQSDTNFQLPYSELITYQSLKRNHLLHTPKDILVFTSPLNVEYYADQYEILPSQSVWAIGETTAHALSLVTDIHINIASKPSEKVLAEEIAKSLED